MNLTLISTDVELLKELQENSYFSVVDTQPDMKGAMGDIVVISDEVVGFNELSGWLNQNSYNSRMFYMLSNKYNDISKIEDICNFYHVQIIPPRLTVSQIVNRINHLIFPDNTSHKNIYVFFGSDDKVGTSMTAISTAIDLATTTKEKVGLFFLNPKLNHHYFEKKETNGLDDIKVKLINNILTSDDLVNACMRKDNLYILPGTEFILDQRAFHINHVEQLLEIASQHFHTILIDAGSNLDSALSLTTLNSTTYKFLVTTQQQTAYNNFQRMAGQVFKLFQIKSNDFYMIVNKYIESNNIFTANQIADMYQTHLITYLPNLEILGWQAEFDKKPLYYYKNEEYNAQIQKISNFIAQKSKLPYEEAQEEKRGFFRTVFKKVGVL